MSRKHKKRKKHGFSGNPSNPKERLLKRISSSDLWTDVRVETRPPGTEKISDVIVRFASPLLDESVDDASYRFALEFAVVVWNLSFLPPEEQANQTQLIVTNLPKQDIAETKDVINMLLQRKATYFSRYQRMIVEYDISFVGDQHHLTVASTEVKS